MSKVLAEAVDRLAAATEDATRIRREAAARELAERRERRERQRVGHRGDLKRLSFLTMARAVPELAAQFSRKIPPEFWTLDGTTAIVSCPCKSTPAAAEGIPTSCACERSYLYDGQAVRVAGGPKAAVVDNECEAAGVGEVGEEASEAS